MRLIIIQLLPPNSLQRWLGSFLLTCVGFHILLSRISNFKPIIYFQQHKNVSLLMFSCSLSVSRGRHVLNILISTDLSINLKQNQIRMNKNYAALRQHTSRTNLIRHCKITALYGITKGEILNIYAPNEIRAKLLIEKKRKSLLSFSGKSPRSLSCSDDGNSNCYIIKWRYSTAFVK